uniref:guanylate-binding protein 4-like n=1 Tax=Myodes glareolus TaxID=447135 RepID=UPI0020207C58|nr:guanylate-binding protein 4-like [Myodes glareolus]
MLRGSPTSSAFPHTVPATSTAADKIELKFDGHVITADEYLEKALKLIPGITASGKFQQGLIFSLLGSPGKRGSQSFLQSQHTIENSILPSDKALTDGQKAIAAERIKKEVAEKKQELLRQKEEEQEQVMEAQERSFRENIAKLQEKMEKERETLLRE